MKYINEHDGGTGFSLWLFADEFPHRLSLCHHRAAKAA